MNRARPSTNCGPERAEDGSASRAAGTHFLLALKPSLPPLIAAWALQIVLIPSSIYVSYHAECTNGLECPGTTHSLPKDIYMPVYFIGSAACILLVIWHFIRLPTLRSRLISIPLNCALGFGAYVLFMISFLSFGHWHK